jgi:hypothetical protein
MKSKYHEKYVLAWYQALETINTKEHINVVNTKEDVFKDYGAILDKCYGRFKPGTRNHPQNHI